ncbi:MAG: vitamin K epoxide reductase family protein [Patescibacteria group bacterium]
MSTASLLYLFGTLGALDTLYLIYHKIRGTDVACPFFPKEWCRTVQYSPQSKTLGIPNSFLGFGMYVAILALTYLHAGGAVAFWPIQAIVTFGFLFSLYFTYVQAFVLRAFCTWCVISAINFTIMFLAVWFS